ncbi:2-hydroxyacyl-CoA dehydratase subunit D [Deferrisoma camini]|uniref:2-hydroxyacyl-CoA dehydratase subunit D n=1 Tax=Deferrisoma camini TaxID=1035120 RepID=UPI00046CD15B|nr:2-hydroxyacyl-CoA dehydratase family protein [Deferrisoma camini]
MPEIKPFRAQKRMKELMAAHFRGVDAAAKDPDRKVAWCTSVGPAELLHSFGFEVYYPENHGAMLGATRSAEKYIPLANALGYSPDICSYLTSDIGAFLAGETPLQRAYGLEGVPRPDVLVYNTNQCRDVKDWFSFYGRRFGVPVIGVNSPTGISEVTQAHVDAMVAQFQALIPTLEEVSGRRFDPDRFREVMGLSAETSDLWKECLWQASHRPAPLTFFDACILMGPAVVLRGTPEAVAFYKELLAELKERVDGGVAAVEGERHRVYWEGMPVWGKLRDLALFFQELRTAVVVSTYCNSWVFDAFDPAEPFESMARAYLELFIVRSDDAKERIMARLIEEFQVDGVVYHDAKTCPHNSNTRYGLPQRLKERTGVPFIVIYGDLNDLRCFSEEQAKTNIEAFVEQLGPGRAAAGG